MGMTVVATVVVMMRRRRRPNSRKKKMGNEGVLKVEKDEEGKEKEGEEKEGEGGGRVVIGAGSDGGRGTGGTV